MGWWNKDPEPRMGGGRRPKKKIVTLPILMVEAVIDVPKGTSDGSPGVQEVFESLYFKLLMSCEQCSNG
jgi:hypothetical protein